jgi:membrane associated rhomboid family serine protease
VVERTASGRMAPGSHPPYTVTVIPPSSPPAQKGPALHELPTKPPPAPSFVPVVTITLVVVLGLIFGLEMLLGGAGSPTLAHMGANVVARTRAGEVERLLAASTLHVAPWHALMNLYVLYSLGRPLEALFGRSRFVLLYFASAVGGGIGTTLLGGEGASAGASGAIWGLLTASAVLAFRPSPSWSPQQIAAARRGALTNLAINVAISFLPGIDKWAHFGGGLVGAILVGAAILVPPRWTVARTGKPESASHTLALRAAAVLLVSATVASVGVAWARGRPWALLDPPTLVRTTAGGVSLELPDEIEESPPGSLSFGVLSYDRVAVQLLGVESIGAMPVESEAANAAIQLDGLIPEGASPLGPAQVVRGAAGPTALRSFRIGDELTLVRAVTVRAGAPDQSGRAIVLDVVTWTNYLDARELALRIADSIE